MPLNKTAIFNSIVGEKVDFTLTDNLSVCVTYMSQLRLYDVAAGENALWAGMPEGPIIIDSQTGELELYMFHGREAPDEELNEWGSDGPRLPAELVIIYPGDRVDLHNDGQEVQSIKLVGDLLEYEGVFYGDFCVDRADNTEGAKRAWVDRSANMDPNDIKTIVDQLVQGKPLAAGQVDTIKRAFLSHISLAAIHLLLSGREWNADTVNEIAGAVRAAGFVIKEVDELEE